jgi:hypothetical protein
LDVSVTATAPSGCANRFTRWLTVANEGGFFGEFLSLDASSSVATTTTCATGLKFVGQPTDALVNSVITGNANDTSGPPVTVSLVDSGGNVVPTSGTPVTIALGNNPASATLGGTLTQNTVNGVATFNDLTLDKPDNGYTLAASSGTLTGTTSNSFNENNTATPCASGATCTSTITSNSGSLKVDVGSGANNATLTESVDVGTPMDGPGSDTTNGCGSYTPPAASADWYEFVVNPPDATTADRTKTVTWTVKNTTTDGFKVCFGAPYEFDAQGTDSGLAPAGTLPDGSPGFIGLLDFCPEFPTDTSPCVSSLTTERDPLTGLDNAVAVITIPAGNVGDPWAAR